MNRIGQAMAPEGSFGREQLRDLPAVRVIPYDYVADFNLTGDRRQPPARCHQHQGGRRVCGRFDRLRPQ